MSVPVRQRQPVIPRIFEGIVPLFQGFAPGHLPSSSLAAASSDTMEVDNGGDHSNQNLGWESKHRQWDGMELDEKFVSLGEKVLRADGRRAAFAHQTSQTMENIMRLATTLHMRLDVASCVRWADYNTMLVKLGDEWCDDMASLFAK